MMSLFSESRVGVRKNWSGHFSCPFASKRTGGVSQIRADAVALAVSTSGVAAGRIATAGHGETELAVATGDGTAEAANRRAVISVTK